MKGNVDKKLIDFIVVGGQRCGTGWLAQCLREHPQIMMAKDESHFFTRNFEKGQEWWVENYQARRTKNKIIGEKCAEYLTSESALSRIDSVNPNIKIVIVVRNPIDRYRSARLMLNRIQKGNVELQQIDAHDFERGLFGKYCERYVHHFGKDNVFIVTYDELTENPNKTIERTYKYLNVNHEFLPESMHLRTKPGAMENRYPVLAKASFLLLHRKSPVRKLYAKIRSKLDKKTTYSAFDDSLFELYEPDISKLEQVMCKDLYMWRQSE